MSVDLRLSLGLPGITASESVSLCQRMSDRGYVGVWSAEVQGPDGFTPLAALAATTDLELGVAVVPAQTRSAFVTGMTALTLDDLSGGRFHLGIGASSEIIVGSWAGLPFDRPLTDVRETVQVLQPMLRGEKVTFEGERITANRVSPHRQPEQPVPLYLGALNPRSLRMVGELGVDGLCLNQMSVAHVPTMLDEVRTGAGGELPDGFGVMARLFCLVTPDAAAGREMVRHIFAPYVATSVYNRFYRGMGYEEQAQAVLDAGRDRAAAAAALTDDLIDSIFCVGPPEVVAARIQGFVDAGVTIPAIAPMAMTVQQAEDQLTAIAQAWGS